MSRNDNADSSRESEIFLITVQLITAVLIGASFFEIKSVFIPLSNLLDVHYRDDAAGIILAYFTVISGWIGYHRSVKRREHLGNLGLVRFVFDFGTLFLVYYLIVISEPTAKDEYGMTFIWVIPALFTFYSVWDLLKMYEYRRIPDLQVTPESIQMTWAFCLLFFILSLTYCLILSQYAILGITFWEKKSSIDIYFISLYFALIAVYRWKKRSFRDRVFLQN